jgi:glycosyltransferase involved in cell wall biosynthesis
MIDIANALAPDFEQVLLSSNEGGIFPEDTSRLDHSAVRQDIWFITRPSISKKLFGLPNAARQTIALLLFVFEPILFLINTVQFVRLIKKVKPSLIVCCNGGYPAAQACLAMVVASRISRVSVVLSIVSMPARRRAVAWLYERALDQLIWRSADVVVVNAKSIAEALVRLRNAPPDKIRVVHNGLEDARLPAKQIKDGRQFVVGCVARMDRAKGVMVLFDAFVRLAERHPEMSLILAGQGDASDELVRRVESLGLQNRVVMLGHFQGDIGVLLSTFDVYVFPSLWEGFPYSIVEALRSACVIVATKVGGIPEAVTDGVEGMLVSPGSSDEIIQAVEQIFANPSQGERLARNARAKFERDLTLSGMHLRVREVLAELKGINGSWR